MNKQEEKQLVANRGDTILLFKPNKNAKRIKVYIPYREKEIRKEFKKINSTFYHPQQKLWSIINTQNNWVSIKKLFGQKYKIVEPVVAAELPQITLTRKSLDLLHDVEKRLVLKQYSRATVKIYKRMLTLFFGRFQNQKMEEVTKEQIEGFVYELITKHGIKETYQNQLINAIKAFYEHVLGKPREYYDIERPKKTQSLPGVLSKEEVFKILQHPKNLKHKAILWTIYSAGLRISELVNLRLEDIRSGEGYIFVKGGKGKKDRKTVLSVQLLELLRDYYKKYKPAYWLFEGQTGGKYSVTSIRKIFRRAVKETNSNAWATVHTLRHSFATHCIENNVNMRYLQNMLGHNSPKTTELYTKTIQINNKNIDSPLDSILKNRNLRT